jgi:two-component system LytT family response regulator
MVFRVLIADDDLGIRTVLKKAISKLEGFEICGEAEDGEAVLSTFEKLKPQIVFIDVEMPKLSGIECAKKIFDLNPRTIIIFATAHDEYMSEAFSMYAFDYIVKPFKLERVYNTLQRIKDVSTKRDSSYTEKMFKNEKGLEKLIIKNKEGISFLDIREIIIIQREDRNTVIYTTEGSYNTSEGLTEIEERLDKAYFFRSHKSYIINLSMIHKIFPYGRWTYIIKLKNTDKDALLTHDKYEELKNFFNQ